MAAVCRRIAPVPTWVLDRRVLHSRQLSVPVDILESINLSLRGQVAPSCMEREAREPASNRPAMCRAGLSPGPPREAGGPPAEGRCCPVVAHRGYAPCCGQGPCTRLPRTHLEVHAHQLAALHNHLARLQHGSAQGWVAPRAPSGPCTAVQGGPETSLNRPAAVPGRPRPPHPTHVLGGHGKEGWELEQRLHQVDQQRILGTWNRRHGVRRRCRAGGRCLAAHGGAPLQHMGSLLMGEVQVADGQGEQARGDVPLVLPVGRR